MTRKRRREKGRKRSEDERHGRVKDGKGTGEREEEEKGSEGDRNGTEEVVKEK